MFDKLFRDPSCKVVAYAKILFIVVLVLCGISLIISVFAGFFLLALILGLISIVSTYIGCLLIATFGEMAQSASDNRFVNAQILAELKKLSVSTALQPVPAVKAEPKKEENVQWKKSESVKENKAEPVQPVQVSAAKDAPKKEENVQEKEPEAVAQKNDLKEALAYALRFSTDEGVRGYIEAKRGQTDDIKEAAVYDAILLNTDNHLRVAIEMYLAEV